MADFRPFSPRWGDISFTEAPRTTARCYAGAIFLSCSPSGRHREPAGVEAAARHGAWPRCRWAAAGPGWATHRHKPRPIGGRRAAWGQATVPVGDGRARAGNTPSPDRLEAAAGPAGPGRTTSRRAERSSRRGRRAGGQATRRPEICRGNKQQAGRPPPTGTHSGPAHQGTATRRPEIRRASSNAGNQAISGSQAPSGLPTWQQHPSARAGAPNRRQPARGPRPRQ